MPGLAARLAGSDLSGRADLLRDPAGSLQRATSGGAVLPADALVALCIAAPRRFVETLIALDGGVAGLLLLAPGLPVETVATLMAQNGATHLVSDRDDLPGSLPAAQAGDVPPQAETGWHMTTSGTTGIPKVVRHTLASLTRTIRPPRDGMAPALWGLLYEPSRFAGLQVVLQSLLGGGTLLAPTPDWPLAERLTWLADNGCSHLSATPTLWRKLLMLPESGRLPLRQMTLGGEIADAGVLRALAARYPAARLTHIYASTEVGAGFSVVDGAAGFPAQYLDGGAAGVGFRIVDDTLWLRPPGGVRGHGHASHVVIDADGYVRTGDIVRRDGDRILFAGRDGGAVNIGGTKVYPEDVEAVVNAHPLVAACRVSATPNPIVGALLTLAVAAHEPPADSKAFRDDIKAWCKARLPREAQPATVRVVDGIETNAAGKIART